MTPYLIAGAALISAAAGFYGGWAIKQGQWDAATVAAHTEREAALSTIAESIQKIDVKQQTIRERVIRETVEKPVYRDCRHEPDSLRDINAALSVPAGASDVPASDAAR